MGRSASGMKVSKGGGRNLPPAPPHPLCRPTPVSYSSHGRASGAAQFFGVQSFGAVLSATRAPAPRAPAARRFQPPYTPDPPEQTIRVPIPDLTFTPLTSSDRHE